MPDAIPPNLRTLYVQKTFLTVAYTKQGVLEILVPPTRRSLDLEDGMSCGEGTTGMSS